MKYQNLLARAGEVPQDAVRRALTEVWTSPEPPEGFAMKDLFDALRDANESRGKPWVQRSIEKSVSQRSFGLREGVTPTEFFQALKGSRLESLDDLPETPFKDWLREDFDKEFMKTPQVDTGVAGKTVALYDLLPPVIPVDTGHTAPETPLSKGPVLDESKMRRVPDLRKVNIPHRPEPVKDTVETVEDTIEDDAPDLFPGETVAQAVGRIQTVLSLYPTAPRFGVSGPHPGLCKGTVDGCEVCGFTKETGEHCHRYEVCGKCLGIGDGSCATARKMEEFGKEEK